MTRRPTLVPLAAALLGATALHAQPPAPPFPPAPGLPHIPAPGIERVGRVRTGATAPRSAIGVYLGEGDTLGVLVRGVLANSPAAKAGIVAGERITAVNGTALRVDRGDVDDPLLAAVPARRMERLVERLAPDAEVTLRVAGRDGRERTVSLRTVAPASLPGRTGAFNPPPGLGRVPLLPRPPYGWAWPDSARARVTDSARERSVLGLSVAPSGSPRDTLGLFVTAVVPGGPAERAGVIEGDRIAAIGDVDLRTPRDERDDFAAATARRARFAREVERARPGDRVTLRVWGDGRWRTVTATVARAGDVYRSADLGR